MTLANLNHAQLALETPSDWTPDRRFIDVKVQDNPRAMNELPSEPRSGLTDSLKAAVDQLNKVK